MKDVIASFEFTDKKGILTVCLKNISDYDIAGDIIDKMYPTATCVNMDDYATSKGYYPPVTKEINYV